MKTIAILTMAFLPGTFTAVSIQYTMKDLEKSDHDTDRHYVQLHSLTGTRLSPNRLSKTAFGATGLRLLY